MPIIKNKLFKNVPDSVCEGCGQCWESECRAFEFAHSKAEYNHRSARPVARCMAMGHVPVKAGLLTIKSK